MIPVSRLHELFQYEPETGIVRRKLSHKRWKAGDPTGSLSWSGYVILVVDGVRIRAHRVIWAMVTGEWPQGVVDHRNHVCNDNRWSNLRDVPISLNVQNCVGPRTNNKSGFLGVHFRTERQRTPKPWIATIRIGPKSQKTNLGCFSTAQEAADAYLAAKRLHHPGNTL